MMDNINIMQWIYTGDYSTVSGESVAYINIVYITNNLFELCSILFI